MVTNQDQVLRAVYWKGKETTIQEIVKETGLKKKQVYMAGFFLKKRGYVKVITIPIRWERGVMIPSKSTIKLRNNQFTEKMLIKKGLI